MRLRRLVLPTVVCLSGVLVFAQDTIKVNVETVQLYANVTNLSGQFVTNLKADDFRILEDGKAQKIDAFTSDDSPLSIGLLFDVNGFMGDNFKLAKEAALTFLKAGNFQNEYFVLEFNDKPEVGQGLTQDLKALENYTVKRPRTKESSTLDAVYLGMETLRSAHNPRKALLVFTSGGYAKNEHKSLEVQNLARRVDVEIFGAALTMPAISDASADPMACATVTPGRCGVSPLEGGYDTAEAAMDSVGGESFAADSAPDFVTTCRRIVVALRNQYIIGYQSTNPAHDGKYRRLEVVLAIRDVPDLKVHTRPGYYAMDAEGIK